MNILFACHRLPFPPTRGGKIRPFNIIKHFKELGHRVTVASLARSEDELNDGQGLRDYCDKLLVGNIGKTAAVTKMVARLPTKTPSSMGYFHSRNLHKLVRSATASQKFDLVFVHCSSAAQYVSSAHNTPSILDFGDMDSQKWLNYSEFKPIPLSAGYWIEGKKLEAEEKRLAGSFDICTCTTKAELRILESMHAAASTSWFPNGVDSDFFCPSSDEYDPLSICFIGRMDYYPNQQAMINFCRSVLPLIRSNIPSVKMTIVGASPSREIRDLSALEGVTVTGTVDDVRPYVRSAALTVAPLEIARGTQNKILESMAMGVPVVASSSAAGGVDAVAGDHLLVADQPNEISRHVQNILTDSGLRQRLADKARRRVETNHSWPASMQKLDTIIRRLPQVRTAHH